MGLIFSFTIRSSISIDVPRQKVWDTLIDFESYTEWHVIPPYTIIFCFQAVRPNLQESIYVCTHSPPFLILTARPITQPTLHRRRQEVINEHDKSPLASQIAVPGRRIRQRVNIPPTMDDTGKPFTTEEILTHVDDEAFRLAWRSARTARWLLTAERWQVLRNGGSVPGGQQTTTTYETWEFFGGLLAPLILLFMGTNLQVAFDAMARALKDRAERVG
ncbi:hypothetical protein B0F90DRAFT_1142818 [Multifurca ochricompacta]|uniref:Uncharacterized protein n=1 Tax=Multifurca ochricompacta TaxID=376703 RepID=A0AAD4LYQ2_9AGAM|nr:hypothetical protein B0F90DRAFT_1142818 [Multifurca ochricompacta]